MSPRESEQSERTMQCPYCYGPIAMSGLTLDVQERMVRLIRSLSRTQDVLAYDAADPDLNVTDELFNIIALLEGRSVEGLDDDEPQLQGRLFA